MLGTVQTGLTRRAVGERVLEGWMERAEPSVLHASSSAGGAGEEEPLHPAWYEPSLVLQKDSCYAKVLIVCAWV